MLFVQSCVQLILPISVYTLQSLHGTSFCCIYTSCYLWDDYSQVNDNYWARINSFPLVVFTSFWLLPPKDFVVSDFIKETSELGFDMFQDFPAEIQVVEKIECCFLIWLEPTVFKHVLVCEVAIYLVVRSSFGICS